MAKMRGIKPDTFTDDKVLRLSPLARWLFVGMWTLACDNGHVEDNSIQLKVRLLPVDPCEVGDLLDEMVATGQVERRDGYLKIVKLTEHQKIDKRFLKLCEWCEHDGGSVFTEADRPTRPSRARGASPSNEGDAHRGHGVPTPGAHRGHIDEGEGEGEGEEKISSKVADAPVRPDVIEILDHFDQQLLSNDPEAKLPSRTKKNLDAARLLIDKDNRTVEQVKACIDFATSHEFWRGVIRSISKLREKYDQLRAQAQRGGSVHQLPTKKPSYPQPGIDYEEQPFVPLLKIPGWSD